MESALRSKLLVHRIKRSNLPTETYLQKVTDFRRFRKGLTYEEIDHTIERASRFYFNKHQMCLVRSLAKYYYLRLYGYNPFFVMEVDFHSKAKQNCHCFVEKELSERVKKQSLGRQNNYVIIEKD